MNGFDSFNYIGSIRLHPERQYPLDASIERKVDRSGRGYIDQILRWKNAKSSNFRRFLARARELDVIKDLNFEKLGSGRYNFKVQVKKKRAPNSILDVGFGVSQVLPMVVADVQLPANHGTLAISQPEIHLHPEMQSRLAEYFMRGIAGNKRTYLVETHSEYLVNRIRYLIAKGDLKEKCVGLYYISHNGKIHHISIKRNGLLQGMPDEFFKTYAIDNRALAIAASEQM